MVRVEDGWTWLSTPDEMDEAPETWPDATSTLGRLAESKLITNPVDAFLSSCKDGTIKVWATILRIADRDYTGVFVPCNFWSPIDTEQFGRGIKISRFEAEHPFNGAIANGIILKPKFDPEGIFQIVGKAALEMPPRKGRGPSIDYRAADAKFAADLEMRMRTGEAGAKLTIASR